MGACRCSEATSATGPASRWFAALRAAPNAVEFHREGKTPFGLASPHDIGRLLEKIASGKLVSKTASDEMLRMMRGQVYSSRYPIEQSAPKIFFASQGGNEAADQELWKC